ncbi:nucleoside monophosphate kinase [Candidatus Woesearchaeota archaeon]|nr:nucleoside monophosphate kinase [Candidatus Woesearchaeota archaeon]
MKLIILGPPGSGKGTVSERLEQEFGFLNVSAGELLRKEAAKKTVNALKIKRTIEAGKLVPNHIVVDMIKKHVKNKRKYLLDGFPRSREQAEAIEDLKIEKVLNLDVKEEVVIERLAGRRVCSQGHHGYHIKYLPPKKAGICDVDGSPLIQRKDDVPSIIKERFKIYHSETEPVAEYYRKKKILLTIDGSGSPEEVYRNVKKALQIS